MRRVHPTASWPAPGVRRVMLVVLVVSVALSELSYRFRLVFGYSLDGLAACTLL